MSGLGNATRVSAILESEVETISKYRRLQMKQLVIVSVVLVASVSDTVFGFDASDRQQRQDLMIRETPDDPYMPGPKRRSTSGLNPDVSLGPWVSVQVNVDEFGINILGDAANEPSIAVDPTNPDIIVIGWRQFENVNSNFRQAGRGYSSDRGQTWTFPGVFEPGVFRSDPVLDSDAAGNIYYYSLRGDFFCHMFKSTDGGVTWSGPFDAFGGDKAWITIDKTGGFGHGHIYAAWSTAGNNYSPNQFIRSTNGGTVWGDLAELSPEQPRWGTLTVDPVGDLYVSGTNSNNLWVTKSTNAKFEGLSVTFESTVEVELGGDLVIFGDPNPQGLAGQFWVAADVGGGPGNGNIYALASVNVQGPDPQDVKFSRSTDAGATWSTSIRINDDPSGTNAWQWFGTMSVAPNGRIDAVWNDTRASGQANLSELYYAYSLDLGVTWSANMPVSPQFNSHLGWPQQNKLGDYYDMVSDNASANLAYAATFHDEQDVYFQKCNV